MEDKDSGVKNPSRRNFLKKAAVGVTAVAVASLLEACGRSNRDRDLIVGIDITGPFATSDGKKIKLDFSWIEAEANQLSETVAGALPYPKIVVKDREPYLAKDGEVGQVTTSLVLSKLKIKSDIKTVILYPSPWGIKPGTVGSTKIIADENEENTYYYGLRVIMPFDDEITGTTDALQNTAIIKVGQKEPEPGLNGVLLCDKNGKVLGYSSNFGLLEEVK